MSLPSQCPYRNRLLSAIASCFIKEQKADFDARIDAPVDAKLNNMQGRLGLPPDMEESVENHDLKETSVKYEENVSISADGHNQG